MFVPFRQGIVATQASPNFLLMHNNNVTLNADSASTVVSFAYQTVDYVYIENQTVVDAWVGPFSGSTIYWLYWDIDLDTGIRTFGYTTINPLGFGNSPPPIPLTGQHFFFYSSNTMCVWDGNSWVPVLRVFAGQINLGQNLVPYTLGTQINLNQSGYQGTLVFDETGSPYKNKRNFFLTTESVVNSQNNPLNNYKIEATQVSGRASEPIPQYSAVTWTDVNQLGL